MDKNQTSEEAFQNADIVIDVVKHRDGETGRRYYKFPKFPLLLTFPGFGQPSMTDRVRELFSRDDYLYLEPNPDFDVARYGIGIDHAVGLDKWNFAIAELKTMAKEFQVPVIIGHPECTSPRKYRYTPVRVALDFEKLAFKELPMHPELERLAKRFTSFHPYLPFQSNPLDRHDSHVMTLLSSHASDPAVCDIIRELEDRFKTELSNRYDALIEARKRDAKMLAYNGKVKYHNKQREDYIRMNAPQFMALAQSVSPSHYLTHQILAKASLLAGDMFDQHTPAPEHPFPPVPVDKFAQEAAKQAKRVNAAASVVEAILESNASGGEVEVVVEGKRFMVTAQPIGEVEHVVKPVCCPECGKTERVGPVGNSQFAYCLTCELKFPTDETKPVVTPSTMPAHMATRFYGSQYGVDWVYEGDKGKSDLDPDKYLGFIEEEALRREEERKRMEDAGGTPTV